VSGERVIEARELVRRYPYGDRVVEALAGVDLDVDAGEFVAVVGPSGCGKSTLLNLLAGVDAPDAGSVRLLGHELAGLSERERSRLRLTRVGFVFQRFHLLAVLTAAENVELPMAEAGASRRDPRERVGELLDYVGLADRSGHRPPHLSGGEQQRVAIARALANRPRVLLADEPTGELDRATGRAILDLLDRVRQDGTAVVAVTHDDAVAERADRIVSMRDGKVVE
jgi:putative ABC transport system ATP-binding protein